MRALYGWLLCLYPREFRRDFGEEMTLVFAQVSSAVSRAGLARRLAFAAREIVGVLCGALEEQFRSIFGLSFVPRRIAMTANHLRFRFPVAGIAFMMLSLGVVLVAIRNARMLEQMFIGTTYTFEGSLYRYPPEPLSVLDVFGFAFGATLVLAVVVWALLHTFHRSGVHRLADAQTWPKQ